MMSFISTLKGFIKRSQYRSLSLWLHLTLRFELSSVKRLQIWIKFKLPLCLSKFVFILRLLRPKIEDLLKPRWLWHLVDFVLDFQLNFIQNVFSLLGLVSHPKRNPIIELNVKSGVDFFVEVVEYQHHFVDILEALNMPPSIPIFVFHDFFLDLSEHLSRFSITYIQCQTACPRKIGQEITVPLLMHYTYYLYRISKPLNKNLQLIKTPNNVYARLFLNYFTGTINLFNVDIVDLSGPLHSHYLLFGVHSLILSLNKQLVEV